MAKLYTKKNEAQQHLKPKKETISFLLQYSKAMHCYALGNMNFEISAN